MFEEIKNFQELQKSNILRGFGINSEEDLEFAKGELEYNEFEKAVYADTFENRKLGRVGQEYHRGKEKSAQADTKKKISKKGDTGFSLILPKTGNLNQRHPKIQRFKALYKVLVSEETKYLYDEETGKYKFVTLEERKPLKEEYLRLRDEIEEERNRWNKTTEGKSVQKKEEEKEKKTRERWQKQKIREKELEKKKEDEEKSDPEFNSYAKENLDHIVVGITNRKDGFDSDADTSNSKEFAEKYYSYSDSGKSEVKEVQAAVNKFGKNKVKKRMMMNFKTEYGLSMGRTICNALFKNIK